MYTPDDRDIDKLSREAAEQYHAPGKPDWNKLQQALDKELPVEKERKRRGFLFFFLLGAGLLLGGGLWFSGKLNAPQSTADAGMPSAAKNNSSTASAERKSSDKPVTGDSRETTASNTSAEKTNAAPAPAAADARAASVTTTDHTNDTKITATTPADKKSVQEIKRTQAIPGDKNRIADRDPSIRAQKQSIAAVNKSGRNQRLIPFGQSTVSDRLLASHSDADQVSKRNKKLHKALPTSSANGEIANRNGDETATETADLKQQPATSNTAQDGIEPAATAAIQIDMNKPAVTADEKKQAADSNTTVKSNPAPKNKKQGNHFIAFGLTAGTDLSTVKFTHNDKPGYSGGLTLGYGINTKWAVYTGLTYTKKNYTLNGKDYHPPQHYWTQYVSLQTVSGDCRMLEIPLSVAYTINPSAKNAVFVSAGISSYLMKKQNYSYYYKNNMGQNMSSAWSNDSTFKHYFSVLDLSAGITRHLSKRVVANIEPYARIPLGGVGFGNIRLSSFGLNFSVQYRQPVKR
jgi:hypothetical protein